MTTTATPNPTRPESPSSASPDADELQAFLGRYGADQAAAMHLSTVVLGEQLGLYRHLAEVGPATATTLAEHAGLDARLVLEWVRVQAVSGYCEYDATTEQFWLTPAQRACLADEGGPSFVAGGTAVISATHRAIEQVAAAFRGQDEVAWGDHDPGLFTGVARAFRPAFETHLVDSWIPALDGVDDRLRAGGRVADLACGFGVSSILIARGYPSCTVAGFDQHEPSVLAARRGAADAGVSDRVTFETGDAAGLRGHDYDLVTIFNALHEMGDPVGVCRRVREVLSDGGRAMLVEPIAGDDLDDNRTPVGRSFLAASTMICLPSARSQGGDDHLGAQASDVEFRRVALAAGFRRCERVAETPLHRVLELTP